MNHVNIEQDDSLPEDADPSDQRTKGRRVDQERARTINSQLVLDYLRRYGPTPQVKLSASLGLSRATISSIIKRLLEQELIQIGEKRSSTIRGGKRATEVFFNADAGYIIGIDLGRSHVRICLADMEAKPLDWWAQRFDQGVRLPDDLQVIAHQVKELVNKQEKTWDQIRGIGFSIPGTPDPTAKKLISPPVLLHWSNVDIPAQLRTLLGLQESFPIYVDNDANLGALGEHFYGQRRDVMNMVYVKLSTGIGAGLILNGQLYRGTNGVAGEFGHGFVEDSGPLCPSCRKRGCLEALAGLGAIVEEARQHSSSLLIQANKHQPVTPERMVDVILAAQEGDADCHDALVRAGKRIGTAIGSHLINMYNPSLILLDGGIIRPGIMQPGEEDAIYINELLFTALKKSAEASSLVAAWQGTEILLGTLSDDAVSLGAVATVLNKDEMLNMIDHW